MESVQKRAGFVLYCLFGVMFFFAISATMTGILIPGMTESYGLSYGQVGLIGTVQSVGSFAATLFGGVLSDRFPKLRLICIVFSLYTVLLYAFGLVPPYVLLIGCFLLLGATNSILNLLISAYVSETGEEKRASYLNLCHAIYGFGSLVGPVFASVSLQGGSRWNESFLQLGVCCTAIAVLTLALCLKEKKTAAAGAARGSLLALVKNHRLLLVSLACLLYMGQQSAVSLWIASYVQDEMNSAWAAGAALTLYWTGVMLGRFIQSYLSRRIDAARWLFVCCTVSAALFSAAFLVGNALVLTAVLFIGAVLTGAAFPTMMAMGCAICPAQTGAATAVVCLGSSIGGMIIPPLIGLLAERVSFTAGMFVIPAALVLCSAVLYFHMRANKPQ